MSVQNFRKEDLVGKSLDRLLTEIENLSREATEDSYQKLEKFITELVNVTKTSIQVSKKDGSKSMEIRGEQVDIVEALKTITEIINTGIDGNAVRSQEEINARKLLREKIASTVGVLLKEDEIMKELASRGITDQEFEKYAKAEIAKSQKKVKDLEPFIKDKKEAIKLIGAVEEGTVELSKGKFLSKSKADDLKHDKAAVKLLSAVEQKLEELAKLQSAAQKLDKNSPDYANDYAANEREMKVLLTDVSGLTQSLKALGLRTSPVKDPAGVKKLDIDFSYLDNLDVNSDFASAKTKTEDIRSKDGANKSLDTLVKEEHKRLYDAKKAIMKKNFAKFGFSKAADVDALSDDAVDKKIEDIKLEIKKVQDVINFEKEYQKQTENSLQKFKEQISREKALNGKLVKVTKKAKVPKMKADGKTPELDADGKPVMEEKDVIDYEPTAAGRKDYLAAAGIADEKKYKDTAVKAAEDAKLSAVENFSTSTKRDFIRDEYRKDGKWHPIKWFRSQFFADRMWESEYKGKYLQGIKPEIDAAKKDAEDKANKEIEAKIATSIVKDKEAKKLAESEAAYVRDSAKRAIISAVSQEKMTDELLRGTDTQHVKDGAKGAAVMTALGKVSDIEMALADVKKKNNQISDEEYNKIKAAYDAKQNINKQVSNVDTQDRAHADDYSKQNRDRTVDTPMFEDR